MAKKPVEIGYNEAMIKIGAILEKLNNEDLDIDALSAEVKQATELIEICRAKLRKAQQDVADIFNS